MVTLVLRSAGLLLVSMFCLGPVLWQLNTSLKPDPLLVRLPPLRPEPATSARYMTVLQESSLAQELLDSLIVASTSTALALVIGGLCAFALARLPLSGKPVILGTVLTIAMFPAIATISPLYLVAREAGLRDTLLALIVVHTTYALPLAIWILTSFLKQVPPELYWAARVDGASPWRAFVSVIAPLAVPGFIVTALLVFIFSWNEFMYALTLTATVQSRTAPVAIALFAGVYELPWGDIAAASMVVTAPVLALVAVFQRYLVAGLSAGAVKG